MTSDLLADKAGLLNAVSSYFQVITFANLLYKKNVK